MRRCNEHGVAGAGADEIHAVREEWSPREFLGELWIKVGDGSEFTVGNFSTEHRLRVRTTHVSDADNT